jgi:ribosomal protein S18 acetylase RimI-like enzyme
MIRKPKEGESGECIKLIYMSGKNKLGYFMLEGEPGIYKYLDIFYSLPGVPLSRDNVFVKTEEDKVCGLILCAPAKDTAKMEKNMAKHAGKLLKTVGIRNLIRMWLRSGLKKYMDNLNRDDEYYISNLAVFGEHRGKGYGVELLQKAEELARQKGFARLSLAVEFYNEAAKKIYEKFGFRQTDRVEFPQKYRKYSLDGFYKMVKVLT